jgi:hypothetical protein
MVKRPGSILWTRPASRPRGSGSSEPLSARSVRAPRSKLLCLWKARKRSAIQALFTWQQFLLELKTPWHDGTTHLDLDPLGPRSSARRGLWADLMRRAFGFDLLTCSRCGGKMALSPGLWSDDVA